MAPADALDADYFATREDILQAAKAIHDDLEPRLAALGKGLESAASRLDARLETLVEERFTKAIRAATCERLDAELGRRLDAVGAGYAERLAALEKAFAARADDLAGAAAERALALDAGYRDLVARLERAYADKVEFAVAACRDALAQMRELIEKMDRPAPVVNVTVPEQAPPVVHVAVPEQAAPVVNVAPAAVPEQVPPVVNVTVPPRRVKKTITYDAYGRPCEIEEVEAG